MKEEEPEIYEKTFKFIGIKEYVFYKLFGRYVVDTAIASATGLLNTGTLQWDKEILEMLDLSEDRLSEIIAVEDVMYFNQKNDVLLPALFTQVPFVIGSSDGALANLGTGSVSDKALSVTIGTSAAVRILSHHPATEESMSIFCYHAVGKQYIIGGASNNG